MKNPPSAEQRRETGKLLRKRVPRSCHATWRPEPDRIDPVSLLEEQGKNRLPWLVPVRHTRMMASPFAFFRAGAGLMATDLATTPVTGLTVQICGDAHLGNFGLYASPERRLVFDLNDFDETMPGPWEWDLKRLATSIVIAARHNNLKCHASGSATRCAVRVYREAMNRFAGMPATDVWYSMIDEHEFMAAAGAQRSARRGQKTIAKAKTKHVRRAMARLTEEVDGQYRIKSEPPLLVPLREFPAQRRHRIEALVFPAYENYLISVPPHLRVLLSNYRPVELAVKVVGVGSVGTRCYILLLEGRDRDDPLFLQLKQANPSALADHLESIAWDCHGRRVVEGQRLMQSVSDIFLGWTHISESGRDYYWRQLHDWKGSVNIENLKAVDLESYAQLCGWTLARDHARSGDPVAIAGYLGNSESFEDAIAKFAESYADQNELDFEKFLKAVRDGRLVAEMNVSG